MPWKNGQLPEWLILLGNYLYAPAMAFAITWLRGTLAENRPVKTFLEALTIGFLTVALVPLLRYMEMPEDLSLFVGSSIAVMGLEWIKRKVDKISRIVIDRWSDK